jgi:DNA-binding phage protein
MASKRGPFKDPAPTKVKAASAQRADSLASWLDRLTESDAAFKAVVEERLSELGIQEELAKHRKRRGLSQADVSRIARLSQPYLAKLEAGEITNPELKTLVRAATALGLRLKLQLEDVEQDRAPAKVARS